MGPKCVWCKEPLQYIEAELDHVIPQSIEKNKSKFKSLLVKFQINSDFDIRTFANLVPIHPWCNQAKSDKVFEGAPFVGAILHDLRKRVPEIEKVHAEFIRQQKTSKPIAQIEHALSKKLLTQNDLRVLLYNKKGTKRKQRTRIHEIFKCVLVSHKMKGSYGKKTPKQVYDISYELFDSKNLSLREFNTLLEAKAINELIHARSNYYNYLKDFGSDDPFFEVDSSHEFSMSLDFVSKKVISYTNTVRTYSTGAAHENYWIAGFTFYLGPLRPVSLDDLLSNYDHFVKVITPIAYDKMIAEIKLGEPDIEVTDEFPIEKFWLNNSNYKPFTNYFFDSKSLTFIFNPYEVSAWAYGAHFPSFSFSELKELFPEEKKLIDFLQLLSK